MFRRATSASSGAFALSAGSFTAMRSVVNHPTPSASDRQHVTHCPRERIAGLDVNRLSYLNEAAKGEWKNPIAHTTWDLKEAKKVEVNHKPAEDNVDRVAYWAVQTLRFVFDIVAGFKFGKVTEVKFINRCVFLETVAGVPGMVAGMTRHMHSLRRMERDHGWIHTLLEEAENERMHLLTFLEMKKPSFLFRCFVLGAQGVFFNFFFLAYLISPRFCHRLVGYIEEEAVKTYTHLLEAIDAGDLPMFAMARCPPLAVSYWKLNQDATFRDLIVAIRADEAGHRLVNHTFADMHVNNMQHGTNPFIMQHAKTMYENAEAVAKKEVLDDKNKETGKAETRSS